MNTMFAAMMGGWEILLILAVMALRAESTILNNDSSSDPLLQSCLTSTLTEYSKDITITICSIPPPVKIQVCILPSLTWMEQAESKQLDPMAAGYEDC